MLFYLLTCDQDQSKMGTVRTLRRSTVPYILYILYIRYPRTGTGTAETGPRGYRAQHDNSLAWLETS
jgi:hypothetical protein